MTLLAVWNRYYYCKNHMGRPLRHSFIREEIRRNLKVCPKGKGAKAWKRLDHMSKGELHLIGNIYIG